MRVPPALVVRGVDEGDFRLHVGAAAVVDLVAVWIA